MHHAMPANGAIHSARIHITADQCIRSIYFHHGFQQRNSSHLVLLATPPFASVRGHGGPRLSFRPFLATAGRASFFVCSWPRRAAFPFASVSDHGGPHLPLRQDVSRSSCSPLSVPIAAGHKKWPLHRFCGINNVSSISSVLRPTVAKQ